MTVTSIEPNDAKAAIAKARREIAEENLNKGVAKLKTKLRERDSAATVVANIDREIAELELSINQGSV